MVLTVVVKKMSLHRMKYLSLLILGCLLLYLSCFNIGDREGRINPFDSNGSNWFPPTVDIIDTVITGEIFDTVAIKVKTSDRNGMVKFLDWISIPEAIDTIDSITGFNDSIMTYDTVISSIEIPYDTTDEYDTSSFGSAVGFSKTIEDDSVIYIVTLDSNDIDTMKYDTASDTTFFALFEDSTYQVKQVVEYDSILYNIDYDTTYPVDSVYYIYSSRFIFDTTGLFELFVTAIDDDGLESEYADSVRVVISDTSLADIVTPNCREY